MGRRKVLQSRPGAHTREVAPGRRGGGVAGPGLWPQLALPRLRIGIDHRRQALAIASRRVSVSRGPTSVTPTGRLCGPRQHGTPTFGTCSSVHIRLNTALPVVCRPYRRLARALGVRITSSFRPNIASNIGRQASASA